MSPFTEKGYFIDTRVINRTTKCATCKTELKLGDIQASTEGPQRTIQRQWIISTFYYCPQIRCITRMPRNGYNQPFCPSKLTLTFSPSLLPERRGSVGLTLAWRRTFISNFQSPNSLKHGCYESQAIPH